MQVSKARKGYKLVDTGFGKFEEIPEEWEMKNIFDVCDDIFLGLTSKVDFVESDGIPLVRANNISAGKLSFKNIRYISKTQHEFLTRYHKSKLGDILMTKSGSLGTCALVDVNDEFSIYESIIDLQPTSKILDSKFLLNLLRDNRVQDILKSNVVGATVGHINLTDFKKLFIPLPSLSEQQKIATILSNVNNALEKTNQLIEKTVLIKNGLMQKLLTKGIGHTKFKKIEGTFGEEIEIPEEWEVGKLNLVAKLQGGFAFKSNDYVSSGIRLLKIANVSHGKTIWNEQSFVPQEYWKKYNDFQIKQGDLILAMTRPIISSGLKISIYDEKEKTLLNQRVGKFIISNIEKDFFYHLLNQRYFFNEIKNRLSESSQPNISSNEIENILIYYPSKTSEQKQIATILSNVDSQITKEKLQKSNLEILKKGLMQKLLTGQIRVKV